MHVTQSLCSFLFTRPDWLICRLRLWCRRRFTNTIRYIYVHSKADDMASLVYRTAQERKE